VLRAHAVDRKTSINIRHSHGDKKNESYGTDFIQAVKKLLFGSLWLFFLEMPHRAMKARYGNSTRKKTECKFVISDKLFWD